MKKLKFLIVVLGLFAAQWVMAVTLPSTSYTPYAGDEQYGSSVVPSGVSIKSGGLLSLGGYDDVYKWTSHCSEDYPGPENLMACQSCVAADLSKCYSACGEDTDCQDWCDEQNKIYQGECGRSLPLDAPLWFMLALAALGTVVTLSVVQRSEESRNMR